MKRKIKKQSADELRQQRKSTVKNGRKKAEKDRKKNDSNKHDIWVPSGSRMLNLACSNRIDGAFGIGTMNNVVGDSSSGKSLLALSGLAECANNHAFDEYDLIYDDSEFANDFNIEKLFGSNLASRIMGPCIDEPDNPELFSTTIEQFGDYLYALFKRGKPFIYVQDSFDAIDSEIEMAKDEENRNIRKKGGKEKGSYEGVKPKKASKLFRQIQNELKKNRSNLLIISQTRDNLNASSFAKKYRAGGKALKFYSRIEAWLTHIKNITKTVHGNTYKIGSNTRVKLGKNKFTGNYIDVDFPINKYYGIDDIASCLDFLIANGFYKKKKLTIETPYLSGTLEKLKSEIPRKRLQQRLFEDAEQCWLEIEEALDSVDRPPKFE